MEYIIRLEVLKSVTTGRALNIRSQKETRE